MTHLAKFLNWNSLDSVRRAHSDLEATGLVFFALLVVMEALAHNSKNEQRKHWFDSIGIWFFAIAIFCEIGGYWYGQRNDELSQQVISSLDVKAQDAANKAFQAVNDSRTALSQAEEAKIKSGDAISSASIASKIGGRAEEKARLIVDSLTPKRLTLKEESDLRSSLHSLALLSENAAAPILVSDSERSAPLGGQIGNALKDAGFRNANTITVYGENFGLGIFVESSKENALLAVNIAKALSCCRVTAIFANESSGSPIRIDVGDVPSRALDPAADRSATGKHHAGKTSAKP